MLFHVVSLHFQYPFRAWNMVDQHLQEQLAVVYKVVEPLKWFGILNVSISKGRVHKYHFSYLCIYLGDGKLKTWTSSNETKARSLEPGNIKFDNTVFLLKVFLSVSLDLVGLEKRFKLLSKIKYNRLNLNIWLKYKDSSYVR